MMDRELVIGTRGSALALWQTRHVAAKLQAANPGLDVRVERITTRGDRVRDRALSQVGGKGLFVKEIETALLAGQIDLAVHSLKDMPTELPEGLVLGAILERADPRDALVARDELVAHDARISLSTLPHGARVGTSSLRRQAQLLALRPDLKVADLRGNVDTRLHKLRDGECDAAVLAVAGLIRLGHADAISERLSVDVMLPAVGQGALCVEVRIDDAVTQTLIAGLDHPPTHQAALTERAFLRRLEGGCRVPIGAYAVLEGGQICLRGLIAVPDGTRLLRDEILGPTAKGAELGVALAERMLAAGGDEILSEVQRGG
jgi:hydroxymethylbilane synthase